MQYFVGFGFHTSTAYEVALKLKESCYVFTEGFQLEQFLHGKFVLDLPFIHNILLSGPFCAIHDNTTVTFIIPPGLPLVRALHSLTVRLKETWTASQGLLKSSKQQKLLEVDTLQRSSSVLQIHSLLRANCISRFWIQRFWIPQLLCQSWMKSLLPLSIWSSCSCSLTGCRWSTKPILV